MTTAYSLPPIPRDPIGENYAWREWLSRLQTVGSGQVISTIVVNTVTPGAAPAHNDLTGLQGGTTGEYYHLTSAQVSLVNSGTVLPYSPGSFTLATEYGALRVKRLTLTTTQRATLQGTSRLCITG